MQYVGGPSVRAVVICSETFSYDVAWALTSMFSNAPYIFGDDSDEERQQSTDKQQQNRKRRPALAPKSKEYLPDYQHAAEY